MVTDRDRKGWKVYNHLQKIIASAVSSYSSDATNILRNTICIDILCI